MKVRLIRSPPVCIWFQLVLGSVSALFILEISSFQQTSYFGWSHFNVSNLVFWWLGVAPGPQMMLFATWGMEHSSRPTVDCWSHCSSPSRTTKFDKNHSRPSFGEIFVLCRTRQEVDILYRYNVSMDGDAIIFATVHYLWLLGPHQPIEYLSNNVPIRH